MFSIWYDVWSHDVQKSGKYMFELTYVIWLDNINAVPYFSVKEWNKAR